MPQQSTVKIPEFTREDIKESFALLLREALAAEATTKERIARVAGVSAITVTHWCSSPETLPGFETAARVISYLDGWPRFLCLLNNRDATLEDNIALAEAALIGARERLGHHPPNGEREAALARLGNAMRLAGDLLSGLSRPACAPADVTPIGKRQA